MTTSQGVPLPPPPPPRPRLVRPRLGRMLGGVAVGLADHLGWPVGAVRAGLVVSTLLGGYGALLYLWLWAFAPATVAIPATGVPSGPVQPGAPPSGAPSSGLPRYRRRRRRVGVGEVGVGRVGVGQVGVGQVGVGQVGVGQVGRGSFRGDLLVGAILLGAGLLMLGARLGYDVQLGVVVPLIVVAGGALLAYTQLDEVERDRWAARTGVGTRTAALRVVGGLALVLTGTLTFFLQSADMVTAVRALVAVLAVLAGTALVLAPWGVRLWRDLDTERAARIREAERADLAAHLHDSVLQTLSLIQRHSGNQSAVTRLARSQERDLRDWLYGPRPADGGTLATEVRAAAADIEDRHGVAVEVVLVGDRPFDERVGALVCALREAIVNAARHAGAPVQVYVESGPDAVEAFVRDRGPGFDPSTVPVDRLGVRESIIARMERHGGGATVRSRQGEGTEVRLVLPGTAPGAGPGTAQGAGPGKAQGAGPGKAQGAGPGKAQGAGPVTAGYPGSAPVAPDSPGTQEGGRS